MDQKEEFIDMVEKNKGLIYKVASFYADNTHDREDLFQEIIYQLWRSFSSFQNNSSVSTWMYQVAMNTAIFFLKKNKRKLPVESLGNEILEYPEPEAAKTEEYFQIMNHHIKGLNLMERGIVMLYLE